jgi:hypothetical protein
MFATDEPPIQKKRVRQQSTDSAGDPTDTSQLAVPHKKRRLDLGDLMVKPASSRPLPPTRPVQQFLQPKRRDIIQLSEDVMDFETPVVVPKQKGSGKDGRPTVGDITALRESEARLRQQLLIHQRDAQRQLQQRLAEQEEIFQQRLLALSASNPTTSTPHSRATDEDRSEFTRHDDNSDYDAEVMPLIDSISHTSLDHLKEVSAHRHLVGRQEREIAALREQVRQLQQSTAPTAGTDTHSVAQASYTSTRAQLTTSRHRH